MKQYIHIGMSGWSYRDWKGIFYPETVKSKDWFEFYARSFNTAEINSSFYRLPNAQTVLNWAEKAPPGFRFCPKMSKYLSHIKRLKEPEEPLERFFELFAPIKKLLGPILIQLPPSLKFDAEVVTAFFEVLKHNYSGYDFAIEGRHITWLDEDATALLRRYKVAWVISQSGVGFPYKEELTAKNVYVRFHGPGKLYTSSYTDEILHDYALKFKQWIKAGLHLWVYFNNTSGGVAINNANTLRKMIGA